VATEVETLRDRRINLYEVLQVSAKASPEVVQAAYRALARAHHPDVNPSPDAARLMKQLNAAYGVLSDPARRARYDALRVRPMRARHESGATTDASRRARSTPRPAYVRPVPARPVAATSLPTAAVVRPVPVIFALVCVCLFIGALVYGLYLVAGALDDEPMRAMVPASSDAGQVVDGAPQPLRTLSLPADIISSALSHSDNSLPLPDRR
jgi:hypothetical protein